MLGVGVGGVPIPCDFDSGPFGTGPTAEPASLLFDHLLGPFSINGGHFR